MTSPERLTGSVSFYLYFVGSSYDRIVGRFHIHMGSENARQSSEISVLFTVSHLTDIESHYISRLPKLSMLRNIRHNHTTEELLLLKISLYTKDDVADK